MQYMQISEWNWDAFNVIEWRYCRILYLIDMTHMIVPNVANATRFICSLILHMICLVTFFFSLFFLQFLPLIKSRMVSNRLFGHLTFWFWLFVVSIVNNVLCTFHEIENTHQLSIKTTKQNWYTKFTINLVVCFVCFMYVQNEFHGYIDCNEQSFQLM